MHRPALFAVLLLAPLPAAALPPLPSIVYRGCDETIPEGTFGCSNAANLRRQVAQSSDLKMGRPMTPTMGVLDANAVDRLRRGETIPLIGNNATPTFRVNTAAGAGGSGSN